jgi:hypothetical protein
VKGYLYLKDNVKYRGESDSEEMFCSEISAEGETFHYANQSDMSGFPIYFSQDNILEKTPSR